MAVKTFQEILNEKLKIVEPLKPEPKSFSHAPEFDLSTVQLGQAIFRFKSSSAYPKRAPAPPQKSVVQPPPDKVIATSLLSEAEKQAIHALEITHEPFLSKNEVRAKHRTLVRKFHPDCHPKGISDLERRLLTEKFQFIQESYQMLEEAFRRHNPKQQ